MGEQNVMSFKRQFFITGYLNIGTIVIGCTIAWTAPVTPKLQDLNESPLGKIVSLSQASWIGSSFIIGGLIGPYLSGYVSNIIGRKRCMLFGGVMVMAGHLITSFARKYETILIGRTITGFGTSIISVMNLVYVGEIASPNIRGILLTSSGVFYTFGSFIMYVAGPYLSYKEIGYLLISFDIAYFLGCLNIPESPVYYAMKGNKNKAISILQDLGRGDDVEKELKYLIENVSESNRYKWTWCELISNKSNKKSLCITVATCIFQECCGVLAVLLFATTIFQIAESNIEAKTGTIIIGATQLVTISIAPLLIEKLGRKTLLLISTAGCGISMASLGVYFYLSYVKYASITSIRWLPLLSLLLSLCSFSFGLGIIPNTLMGEMFRPNVRSIGTSISMTSGWVAGVISVTSFGYIVEAFGSFVIFFIYSITNLIGFIFIFFVVPETKGLSLREIEIMLSN